MNAPDESPQFWSRVGGVGMRLLRWMDRHWVVSSAMLTGVVLGVFFGVGPERFGRTTIELGVPVVLGVATLVAAVIGARGDREERQADARHEAFRRALAERERRDGEGGA